MIDRPPCSKCINSWFPSPNIIHSATSQHHTTLNNFSHNTQNSSDTELVVQFNQKKKKKKTIFRIHHVYETLCLLEVWPLYAYVLSPMPCRRGNSRRRRKWDCCLQTWWSRCWTTELDKTVRLLLEWRYIPSTVSILQELGNQTAEMGAEKESHSVGVGATQGQDGTAFMVSELGLRALEMVQWQCKVGSGQGETAAAMGPKTSAPQSEMGSHRTYINMAAARRETGEY